MYVLYVCSVCMLCMYGLALPLLLYCLCAICMCYDIWKRRRSRLFDHKFQDLSAHIHKFPQKGGMDISLGTLHAMIYIGNWYVNLPAQPPKIGVTNMQRKLSRWKRARFCIVNISEGRIVLHSSVANPFILNSPKRIYLNPPPLFGCIAARLRTPQTPSFQKHLTSIKTGVV